MKRRTTKKGLKDSQWLLADALRLYFERPRDSDTEDNEQLGRSLVELALMLLIDFRMQLNPLWLDNKRELKKVNLSAVSVDNPHLISGYGETQWREMNGDVETEVVKPIELKVHLTKPGKRWIDYSILIGGDNESREISGVLKIAA